MLAQLFIACFMFVLFDGFDSVAKFLLRAPYYVGDSVAIIAMDHVSKYLNILANAHNAFNRLRFENKVVVASLSLHLRFST